MFKLNWANIKSAVVYGIVTMGVAFVFTALSTIYQTGSIFGLNWKYILDISTMSALGIFVSTVSVVKNLLTDSSGKFMGVITVIPDKKPALPEWVDQD